jgi:hypothetical protein
MIFLKDKFLATEIEKIFSQKVLGDIHISLQPGATSLKYAKDYLRHSSWELGDLNSAIAKPIQLGTFEHGHPLPNT